MSTAALVEELKVALGIQPGPGPFDAVLMQKVIAIVSFLQAAGASAETLASEAAIGAIVLGAGDLFNAQSGEVKFSPAFLTLATQLAAR